MKINKKTIITLLFLFLGANSLFAHPFYVSICQVKYNRQTNALEIALKTFVDDLILGLENNGRNRLHIGEKNEHPEAGTYIFEYVDQKMTFWVNSKVGELAFVGWELEEDVVWSYYEITEVADLKHIEVESSLLTEVLESQSNIVQVNSNGTLKNLLLNKRNKSGKLEF